MGEQEANMAEWQSESRGGIVDLFVDIEFDRTLKTLFSGNSGYPYQQGKELLRSFAESRPSDFGLLQTTDVGSGTNSAFAGIPEWDAFAEHYASCGRCHA